MKKYITFNNFLLVIALGIFFMGFAPCIKATNIQEDEAFVINLFKATFGGQISTIASTPIKLIPCAGLIAAFVCAIIAMVNTILKNKCRYCSLLATPFYLTAGILVACSKLLFVSTNYMVSIGSFISTFYITGWTIAIACMFCIIGVFSLIDAAVTLAKPKAKEVY